MSTGPITQPKGMGALVQWALHLLKIGFWWAAAVFGGIIVYRVYRWSGVLSDIATQIVIAWILGVCLKRYVERRNVWRWLKDWILMSLRYVELPLIVAARAYNVYDQLPHRKRLRMRTAGLTGMVHPPVHEPSSAVTPPKKRRLAGFERKRP